ncbi:MAG: hypothetical protein IJW70_02890 [Clostridia bacterium]|nr:hypothetical protein [Clostridia bacterium]
MRKIVVILTACLLLAGMMITVGAQTAASRAVDYDDLNYSVDRKKAGIIYMGQILEQLTGQEISDEEKDFIRYKFNGQNVLYYTKPMFATPTVDYDGENYRLSVIVMDDYYEAENGQDVFWTPDYVTIGEKTAEFAPAPDVGENYYRAVFEDVEWTTDVSMTIEYSADLILSAETLNEFVNFAFDGALILDSELAAYEHEQIVYQEALAAYEQNRKEWLVYNTAMDAYRDHMDLVALYNDYLAYQDYLAEMKVYEQDLAAYLANKQEWETYDANCIKFNEYLAYKATYPGLDKAYQSSMATVEHQLYLLSLMEVEDPVSGISFVELMIDDRIGTVIEERYDQFAKLEKSTVDAVVESTRAIQRFCKIYQDLETDQEIYEFYIKEYASFVKHLNQLYVNIKKLYNNNTFYKILMAERPQYLGTMVRMLGSLHVYSHVFDDTITLKSNAIVDDRGHQTVNDLVSPEVRPASDTNKAKPLSAWPVAPVDPETYEVTKQPTAPQVKLEDPDVPEMPSFTAVGNASEIPTAMQDPGEMEMPQPPKGPLHHPGTPPTLAWDELTQSFYRAYLMGKIVPRAEFASDQVYRLSATSKFSASLDENDRRFFVHFYNTDDEETYLGSTHGVHYGEGVSVPESIGIPTKPPKDDKSYEFAGWVDKDGTPIDLSCITQDINAYASYNTVPRTHTVTWHVGEHTTVQEWVHGQIPVYEGPTEKASTDEYDYTFVGWNKTVLPVTEDVVYTAQYSATIRRYTVTFMVEGGVYLQRDYNYAWNLTDAVSMLSTPYKEPTVQYSYTFKGWSDAQGNLYTDGSQFPLLTESMTFYAEFDATVNSYTVTWIVEDQSITKTYLYGDMPMYGDSPDDVPGKETTAQYEYTFAGWDKEFTTVVGDATYTASFDAHLRSYMVEFLMDDGSVLYSQMLEYGAMPEYAEFPKKQSDIQNDYFFIDWDKDIEPVSGPAKYTARFGSTLRKYPIKFVVGDTEVTSDFEYGSVPQYPYDTPTAPDDSRYTYVFAGWDVPLAAVDGSAVTYTACFDAVPLAPTPDGEHGEIKGNEGGVFELILNAVEVDLSKVFQKAGEGKAEKLVVRLGDAVLEFPKVQIEAIYNRGEGIASVRMERVMHEDRVAYQIEILDEQGNPVEYLVSELTVRMPYSVVYAADVYHIEDDGTLTKINSTYENGYLVFSTMDFSTFVIKDRFSITGAPSENGVFDVVGEAYDGDVVTITPDPNEGYHLDTVTVECNGQAIKLEQANGVYTFIMPKGNVTVTTTFKEVEGGTGAEVMVGVITASLIVVIGIVIAIVLGRKKVARK